MKFAHTSSARYLVLLLCLLAFSTHAFAQEELDIPARYTKTEQLIPMRDGVKLFTSIYVPKDTAQKYPIMFNRTPYSVSPYGADKFKTALGPSPAFAREGYIFVYQDVRGRYMSEGEYVNVRPHRQRKSKTEIDESTDTYDTVEWLMKNVANHNGRVGMWGISYPGFYVSSGIINSHPAIKAASPQAPIADWFIGDDFHHNGALFLPHAFNFLVNFGRPRPLPVTDYGERFEHGTPDGYKFFLEAGALSNLTEKYMQNIAFWNELMEHPNYDDFWQARNILPHLKNIKPAVMTVGGWFDAEDLYGALETYDAIERQNPGIQNSLVMGPWFHGGWARGDGDRLGNVSFDEKTSIFYREQIELPFFNFHLKDKGALKLPEAYVFNTGANRWRTFDTYPPRNVKQQSLYLHANGRLAFDAPTGADPRAFDEYVSDPARPVPFINNTAIGMTREYMTDDQRHAATRPDVLVYQTGALTEDVTITDAITARLFVTTTGTDSDFIVKLIDVYPDDAKDPDPNPAGVRMGGYQMLVRGEPMRARFRNSFSKPEAMEPNQVTKIEFTMPDALHTFKKGHRIMVQIQSTWFPLVDRNPQRFVNIYKATDRDFQRATQRVYRSNEFGSQIRLSLLN